MKKYAIPKGTTIPDSAKRVNGMGSHTDFGIVTVLWCEQVPGLQVLYNNEWRDVMPVSEDALIINIGDLTSKFCLFVYFFIILID